MKTKLKRFDLRIGYTHALNSNQQWPTFFDFITRQRYYLRYVVLLLERDNSNANTNIVSNIERTLSPLRIGGGNCDDFVGGGCRGESAARIRAASLRSAFSCARLISPLHYDIWSCKGKHIDESANSGGERPVPLRESEILYCCVCTGFRANDGISTRCLCLFC